MTLVVMLLAETMGLACRPTPTTQTTNPLKTSPAAVEQAAGSGSVGVPLADATGPRLAVKVSAVICGIYRDVSPSVNVAVERAAGAVIGDSLDDFIGRYRCTELRYGSFAAEGPFLLPERITLPAAETGDDCEHVISAKDRALDFLPGARDAARRRCHQKTDAARDRSLRARDERLQRVRQFLTADVAPRGTCTSFIGLLQMLDRSRSNADVDIIVSDGAESCVREIPAVDLHHLIYLVQCPRSGDPRVTGPEALSRAQVLTAQVKNLRVVLPAEISTGFWQHSETTAHPALPKGSQASVTSAGALSGSSFMVYLRH